MSTNTHRGADPELVDEEDVPPISRPKRQRCDDSASSVSDAEALRAAVIDISSTTASQDEVGSQPTVIIYLGDQRQRVLQSEFLSHVWGQGLDSKCHACGDSFVLNSDPAIRTITFEASEVLQHTDFTSTLLAPHPLRIYNRHFSCIQAKGITYIPVSHAWHQNVSLTQRERRTDQAVARLVYQTPMVTLLALTRKYGPAEIWHDYLSVPQWQRDIQGQLLLKIPIIYSYPATMMIHLDDVREVDLSSTMAANGSYGHFKSGLLAITNSRWFERMWVTLEYIQANDVVIFTEDLVICDYNARFHSLQLDNAASKHIKRIGHTAFFNELERIGCKWRTIVSWGDMETWKNSKDKHHTLGGAVYIMGTKKCQEQKDYYLALAGMIQCPLDIANGSLPQDPFSSFLSLAMHAFEKGDYTPLLFTPLRGESADGRAPWLRGYSRMSELFWDLGVCHQKAESMEIVRNGRVQPKLESVGVIETWDYIEFTDDMREFLWFVAERILRSSGTCPREFCCALDRILTPLDRKALYTNWGNSKRERNGDFGTTCDMERLETILAELEGLLALDYPSQPPNPRALAIVEEIDSVLRLEQREKNSKDNRKAITMGEIEWHQTKHGRTMDGVARVRCRFCARRFAFRLTCWKQPTLDFAQVYRIPGLLYDETVPNGVGLVLCGGTIIGKMQYGTPACGCRRSQLVEIN